MSGVGTVPERDARLAEVVATLSLATDLGVGQPAQHGLRACLLSVRLGDALGQSEGDLAEVYYFALLRFAGCTAESPLTAATFGDELAVWPWLGAVDPTQPWTCWRPCCARATHRCAARSW